MSKALTSGQLDEAEQVFTRYLRRHRIKYTKPRRAILRAALQHRDHFEAEQLLAQLSQSGEKVAKATIYRTLPLLVDCGVLRQVRFSDTQAHYEHALGADPHDHMICRRCGRIIEFSSLRVEQLRAELARESHFHDLTHRFQIWGLCSACTASCPVGAGC